ncbi:MAG: arabinofuranosidase catalytic domain-containing protein [Rhizomicrobium sp.]
MKTRINFVRMLALALTLTGASITIAAPAAAGANVPPPRPQGPCDIYAAAGAPCVAAHSTTRALYASYNGPLYQILRQSDGKTLDISVVQPVASPVPDAGGYADAAAQDAFCAHTYCWITILYDQSGKHNDLTQPPRGGFSGPAMGGFDNLPIADMAPITIMGHKVYGIFIAPGMGLRRNDTKGTAVDDQAEGQYWVINGRHYNNGCCFDYGNAETDSLDDGNGTMETTYYGNASAWYHGNPPGPWTMTDQENNLVGCVNPDGSKLCAKLPNIDWRFVTAMAKGNPHHWTSMGGDAQKGALSVMFDGPRIDATYDPMRKQGAILLGNGGDNSNGSQGTFYEGAMTAAGTFPSDATDQAVQANIVAAKYDVPMLTVAPASAVTTPPGLQTFSPRSSRKTTITFTNTTGVPVAGVTLNLSLPKGWRVVALGAKKAPKTFAGPLAADRSVSATFQITSGAAAFNGDLIGKAAWTVNGRKQSATAVEKVRNVSPVKINEFRVSDGSANTTNSFIELYNVGTKAVDLSGWTLTEHANQQAVFSSVLLPAGTKLAPRGFYLLGLSNSGLAIPARTEDSVIHVRNIDGMKAGDTIVIGTGTQAETRKIAGIGTVAASATTLWQPLPEGPVITIPAGSTNVPVTDVAGFKAGEKIALGYGATYPVVGRDIEKYEVATVTEVGKPGTQAYLEADAPAGAINIQTAAVENISAGDKIRLDIDSVGHGIETVTVGNVGTAAKRTVLIDDASAGATAIKVRGMRGYPEREKIEFTVGAKLVIGTPANRQTVTITAVGFDGPMATLAFAPALAGAHIAYEDVVELGTGLELTAPLKFNHAANMPFSVRGTGISFTPATSFAHSSNEPVQALGTGITLDKPLTKQHAVDAPVRDAAVGSAGYQGAHVPNQWFGGPALSVNAGSMVLRDATGRVVDSLNYGNFANNGNLVDPWLYEGYQAISGLDKRGCFVVTPGAPIRFPPVSSIITNSSAGRFPDGRDTDSNCTDVMTPSATILLVGSKVGAKVIKVFSVDDFSAGQTVMIDPGANYETAMIANVGTAGVTTVRAANDAGATVILLANPLIFSAGQAITIDDGANYETAVVASIVFGRSGIGIAVTTPLKFAHAAGAQVSGTGITFTKALTRAHASGVQVTSDVPTPGAPNKYSKPRPHL